MFSPTVIWCAYMHLFNKLVSALSTCCDCYSYNSKRFLFYRVLRKDMCNEVKINWSCARCRDGWQCCTDQKGSSHVPLPPASACWSVCGAVGEPIVSVLMWCLLSICTGVSYDNLPFSGCHSNCLPRWRIGERPPDMGVICELSGHLLSDE